MNPNDPIYEAMSPEQKLKVLWELTMARHTGQPPVEEEKPKKGWSEAQLAGFDSVRALYAEERYPTWLVKMLIKERIQPVEDPHTALGSFAPQPEIDLTYYGALRARRKEGQQPYIQFGQVIEIDSFPGKKWVPEEPLAEELQCPPTPITAPILRTHYVWSEREKEYQLVQEMVQDLRVLA